MRYLSYANGSVSSVVSGQKLLKELLLLTHLPTGWIFTKLGMDDSDMAPV